MNRAYAESVTGRQQELSGGAPGTCLLQAAVVQHHALRGHRQAQTGRQALRSLCLALHAVVRHEAERDACLLHLEQGERCSAPSVGLCDLVAACFSAAVTAKQSVLALAAYQQLAT